jgi:hypothetical protein
MATNDRTIWTALEKIAGISLGLGVGLVGLDAVLAALHGPKGYLLLAGVGLLVLGAVLGIVAVIGDHRHDRTEVRYGDVPTAGPFVISLSKYPAYGYYSPGKDPKSGVGGVVQLEVKGFAASASGEPITLLSATADVQIDDRLPERVEATVAQRWDKSGPPPPHFRFPPVIDPGETVEIEIHFYVPAPRDGHGHQVAASSARIAGLTVQDSLRRTDVPGDIDPFPVFLDQDG